MLIGDLGAAAGMSAKTIRFYEQSGLLPAPPRTPGGYRDYPAAAVARLAFIRQAQAAGLTLAEIAGILRIRDGGQAPCQHVTALIGQHLAQVEQRVAELTRTRDALADLHRRAVRTESADYTESQVCSILTRDPEAGSVTTGAGEASGTHPSTRRASRIFRLHDLGT